MKKLPLESKQVNLLQTQRHNQVMQISRVFWLLAGCQTDLCFYEIFATSVIEKQYLWGKGSDLGLLLPPFSSSKTGIRGLGFFFRRCDSPQCWQWLVFGWSLAVKDFREMQGMGLVYGACSWNCTQPQQQSAWIDS